MYARVIRSSETCLEPGQRDFIFGTLEAHVLSAVNAAYGNLRKASAGIWLQLAFAIVHSTISQLRGT